MKRSKTSKKKYRNKTKNEPQSDWEKVLESHSEFIESSEEECESLSGKDFLNCGKTCVNCEDCGKEFSSEENVETSYERR